MRLRNMLHDLATFLTFALTPPLAPGAVAPAPVVAVVAPVPVVPAPTPTPLPTPVPTPAPVDSAAATAVGKVQAFYAGVAQVSTKFRQQVENATFGDTKISDGKVFIQKPGKMRWDYYAKASGSKVTVKKSFISNGTYLYVVEHENKQVIKKDLSKDVMPVAISFLYGKGDLRTDFVPALDTSGKYGSKGDVVIKLTPKTPSAQYKQLILVTDPADYRVKESIVIDPAGSVNRFSFFEPDFKSPVKASWFEFDEKSVKSYRIVDGDAAGAADVNTLGG